MAKKALVISVVLGISFFSAGFKAIHEVPSRYPTIQAAIDAAADGDIVLVADGTYSGPNNMSITFRNKSITVKSENGPENCIVDCRDEFGKYSSGFGIGSEPNQNSVLDGFKIINAHCAIYCSTGSATIRNCNPK